MRIDRRQFGRLCAKSVGAAALFLSACASRLAARDNAALDGKSCDGMPEPSGGYDYVVVGSGAGGGPLACRLALAGHTVLLLEAGGDEEPYDYQVPVFHAEASENDELRWSFYVRHYSDDAKQKRDPKFVGQADGRRRDGILYPRSGTLGGCTAHNAMIMIYPHNQDWDGIARITGDASWESGRMRGYFERMERCEYASPGFFSGNAARHGYDGWITTNVANPTLLVGDWQLKALVKAALNEAGQAFIHNVGDVLARIAQRLENHFDPNDWRAVQESLEGICMTPITTDQGRRTGAREFIRRTQKVCPNALTVRKNALATRVVLDERRRATGVEYIAGAHLYRADPKAAASGTPPARVTVNAKREVILSGGAFNTPQLLMLSGVGPRDELQRHGIAPVADLPGVGRNLQDRYEVGVVSRMKRDFSLLQGATFRAPLPGEKPDPQFVEWQQGSGVYTTNGAIIAIAKRSDTARPLPDLYLFGLAGYFRGYFPGYSKEIARGGDHFTWCVLKAHTRNTAGYVRLRSADPLDTPEINFRYFEEGNDAAGEDLDSVVAGIEFVRRMGDGAADVIAEELVPGRAVAGREALRQYVRDNAWGHHASCTCKIGADGDAMAVLDSKFRVRGVSGLRVVDASVFPAIPGFFIVSAVYMVSEKAADVILADARASAAPAAVRS